MFFLTSSSPDECRLVFDVTQSGYRNWWFPVAGLFLVLVAVASLIWRRPPPAGKSQDAPFFFLVFAVFWTIVALVATSGGYVQLASDLREGRCEVVEGEVTEFHPMPFSGHQKESFVVAGRRFEYSDFEITPGFNTTTSHGGPIHAGLRVRIHHAGNDIARLEVAP